MSVQNSRRMSIQAIFSHQIMHTVITVGTDCTVYADRVLCKFCADCEQYSFKRPFTLYSFKRTVYIVRFKRTVYTVQFMQTLLCTVDTDCTIYTGCTSYAD